MKFKSILNKIAFKFLYLKYEKNKQFYLSVFIIIIIVTIILTLLTIKQHQETKIKENILKAVLNSNNSPDKNQDLTQESLNQKPLTQESLTKNSLTQEASVNTNEQQKEKLIQKIKVYICGEINNAGVYELDSNSRVIDLINIAGGTRKDAYLESINLAEILTDSQKIYIPSKEEILNSEGLNSIGELNNNNLKNKIININFAGKNELELLPGIGPELAQRIIDYRKNIGAFKKKEDLKNVTGIGEKKYEAIKDLITV